VFFRCQAPGNALWILSQPDRDALLLVFTVRMDPLSVRWKEFHPHNEKPLYRGSNPIRRAFVSSRPVAVLALVANVSAGR